MPARMLGTFFRLVGKAMRMAVARPIQRFNIFNRVKKHLGEESKYFMPAPRAIGPQSLRIGKQPLQYPHLEGPGTSGFKSIKQRREDAIAERNHRLLSGVQGTDLDPTRGQPPDGQEVETAAVARKSFSETINDDDLVISTSSKLPVIKTVTRIERPTTRIDQTEEGEGTQFASSGGVITPEGELVTQEKPKRPLPTSTSLQLSDPAVIWQVDKVPPGRLDLSKLQELMINKLADDAYWTPKQIAESYNIKEAYAENLITYFKQIRIIVSPRLKKALDYVARTDEAYQATQHIVYYVDKNLRSEFDKQFDKTFLPTDELDPEVRELIDAGDTSLAAQPAHSRLTNLIRRPEPLRLEQAGPRSGGELEQQQQGQLEAQTDESTSKPEPTRAPPRRQAGPLNVKREP